MGKDFLCAAESGSDSISVYSLSSGKRERTFTPENAKKPHHLLTHDGLIYHTDSFSGTVGFVGVDVERIVSAGAYPTCALMTDGGLFVTCGEANSVWLLDPYTLEARACADTACFPICAARSGKSTVCAALFGCALERFDDRLELLQSVRLENMPLCAASDGDSIYAGCIADGGGELLIIRGGETFSVKTPLTGAIRPLEDGRLLLLHVWDDSLTIFDTRTNSPCARAKTARLPDDAVYSDGSIYVSCMQSDVVQRFDENAQLVSQFKTLREPRGLALL